MNSGRCGTRSLRRKRPSLSARLALFMIVVEMRPMRMHFYHEKIVSAILAAACADWADMCTRSTAAFAVASVTSAADSAITVQAVERRLELPLARTAASRRNPTRVPASGERDGSPGITGLLWQDGFRWCRVSSH